MFWPDGDVELARAAAKAGIPFILSTASTTRIEEVAERAGGETAADVGDADQRDRRRPERRGRGDAEPRQQAPGRDRGADLGDEGGEMRGDEAELVAAGEEA
ncbi:alpha-hydroxy-acid oxidizing protein, partial [Salmonella enterica subsp. enterica serovar 1,4,[5],12:i:-]